MWGKKSYLKRILWGNYRILYFTILTITNKMNGCAHPKKIKKTTNVHVF